jgi:hypothetical protein
MSEGAKYEYQVSYFEGYSGREIASETQRNLTYMTGEGWELHQLNPSVVSVDNSNGSLMPFYSTVLTFRRPVE